MAPDGALMTGSDDTHTRGRVWRTLGGSELPLQADEITLSESGLSRDEISSAGKPPYTRGIHTTMYRDKQWTMRQYAGFSSAEATNERFKLLLENGQNGLSIAFDLPTQLGLDSDDELAQGEVGKVGVAIDSIHDMRRLFAGIPLADVSTSMTINAPAMVILAMDVAVAEEQGINPVELRGTIQNDILKEYIARGTYIFPPAHSMRLITDTIAYCGTEMPLWNTISISGYHIREAGSTAIQEVAFTLANALEYVQAAIDVGLEVDTFAPRLSFFFNCHNDFFEEVAKFRAARALWYELMEQRYSPSNPKSSMLRFHTQVAGVSLTAQQPLNNIARVTIQALAAVCGGTQSLHTNSYDEAIGLPTAESVTVALRTQQIIADESGAASVVDPMGGSWLVESLTKNIKEEARREITNIDALSGALKAIEDGYQQRAIHDSAWQHQKDVESGRRKIIGLNHGIGEDEITPTPQAIDPEVAARQVTRLSQMRESRDAARADAALVAIGKAAGGGENLFPLVMHAVKCECSLGEIIIAMKQIFGSYRAPSGF